MVKFFSVYLHSEVIESFSAHTTSFTQRCVILVTYRIVELMMEGTSYQQCGKY